MEYGQFCPISKASEIIGEKWTILIIRELLMGGTRFNEIHRGVSLISPTVLSKRLESLNDYGLVVKKKIPGQKGYEYFPTDSCKQLHPIILSLGEWGVRWAKSNLTEKDYDVELLMLYLERSIVTEKLPGKETVLRFMFTDVETYPDWWIVVKGDDIDVCTNDPGKDIDLYITTTVKTMVDVWMGYISYSNATRDGVLKLTGDKTLSRTIKEWLQSSVYADLPPATNI
jgi:DNA-binding HxlR family transcriptional regulator